MKHFGIYRKLILIIGTATAVVSVGVFFFMEDILFRTLFISFAFVFLCGLLFLMDFLHNRYNDNLLEEITLLIEALVEQQERMVFSEAEDTLTARLQHQLLKLRNILKAQNQMLTQEKEQIKTLISDISHQIKTPVAAANTFAQLLGDTGLSDEERSEYIATLQMSLEKLTFLTNSLIKMSRLESGIIRLKPEQNSLNDIVMQAVKTVYAKARDKNITITFDCGQTFEALLDFNWTAEAVYYIFKEGAPDQPPTNWQSKFGGSAWEYVSSLGKWYLHLFDVTQADLNWKNPEVREELKEVIRFWKAKGVKGFRFDVVNLISKPEIWEDDFEGDGRKFYTDGPYVHEYLKELVRDTGIEDYVTVGEMSSTTLEHCIRYSGAEEKELSMDSCIG